MISQFPEFTKVTPELKEESESYTHRFEPYSDFNFFSFWSWDTVENRKVSVLDDNLVVQMTDYVSGEPRLSFLGNKNQAATAKTLIDFARSSGISETLQYVPEVSISSIDDPDLVIKEERNDFDYIFSVKNISELKGNKYSKKRQLKNLFVRNNPTAIFIQERMVDISSNTQIFSLLKSWQSNKKSSDKEFDSEHEPVAIDRLLKIKDKGQLIVSYVMLDDDAIAFSIDEILPNKFALAHYSKFDVSYRGINEFLNFKIANSLLERGVELWNWEQDLGLQTLRHSKMSYVPTTFIKKYNVTLK